MIQLAREKIEENFYIEMEGEFLFSKMMKIMRNGLTKN